MLTGWLWCSELDFSWEHGLMRSPEDPSTLQAHTHVVLCPFDTTASCVTGSTSCTD